MTDKPQATPKRRKFTLPSRNDMIDTVLVTVSKARKPTEIERFRDACDRVLSHMNDLDQQDKIEVLGHLDRVAQEIDYA